MLISIHLPVHLFQCLLPFLPGYRQDIRNNFIFVSFLPLNSYYIFFFFLSAVLSMMQQNIKQHT